MHKITSYKFKGLLQNEGWITPAYVGIDEGGRVTHITKTPLPGISYTEVNGHALPGIPNAHSHAFQYAMVGLTESHDLNHQADDFWSWRKAMYELALSINPDQMEAIATMLYKEMLRHGYTHVVEFHYVHHDKSGLPYDNLAELGARLISAANTVGIKITLVPIFYQKGGFGQDPSIGQRRFISPDVGAYLKLYEASKKATNLYSGAHIGGGIHSLRAVQSKDILILLAQLERGIPFHMHVSEQLKEVADSLSCLGCRPVEWLVNNIDLGQSFHLVHGTHLTIEETKALANNNVNIVLCPSTEGNLGDGLFNLPDFQNNGGNWCIGTDSHIGLSPFEELRLLDYGQRLTSHKRNIFYDKHCTDSGSYALEKVIGNGRKAAGVPHSKYFEIGQSFDSLILDAGIPILEICDEKYLTSTIVYASDASMHLGTMVNGKWVVQEGNHHLQETINANLVRTLRTLKNRI